MDFYLNAKACWGGVTKQENMTHFGLLPSENESSHLHSWSQPVQIPSGSYSFLYVIPYSTVFHFLFTTSFFCCLTLEAEAARALRTPRPHLFLAFCWDTWSIVGIPTLPQHSAIPVTWCMCSLLFWKHSHLLQPRTRGHSLRLNLWCSGLSHSLSFRLSSIFWVVLITPQQRTPRSTSQD